MNPFPYIEKWITEHGSAAALRDHVALLKSQMEALKSQVADLKSERDDLKAELKDAREQIERLKKPPVSGSFVVGRRSRGDNRSIDG